MSDLFQISGSITVGPSLGAPSGDWNLDVPLSEAQNLSQKCSDSIDLTTDSPVSVPLGGVANVHVLYLKNLGGPVTVAVTSAAGTSQAMPLDGLLVLESLTTPITALTFTRSPGVLTTVKYFVGQV